MIVGKKYRIRIYQEDGKLAQKPFTYEFGKEIIPGMVINIPNGIFKGPYKVIAIGNNDKSRISRRLSEDELLYIPRYLSDKIRNDLSTIDDELGEIIGTIFAFPATYYAPAGTTVDCFSGRGWLISDNPKRKRFHGLLSKIFL